MTDAHQVNQLICRKKEIGSLIFLVLNERVCVKTVKISDIKISGL